MLSVAARHRPFSSPISGECSLSLRMRTPPRCCVYSRNFNRKFAVCSSFAFAERKIEKKIQNSIIGNWAKHQPNSVIQHGQREISSNSIDRTEIRQFQERSDFREWLDENQGSFRPLHSFNRVRIPWISARLGNQGHNDGYQSLRNKRILDVGCGAGILSLALCRLGAAVTGLDAVESMTEMAEKHAGTLSPEFRTNAKFLCGTVEQMASDQSNLETFDAIVASEVVEHVSDLPLFVQCCCKLARQNSPIFFTTINRTLWSKFLAKFFAEDVLQLLPKDMHDFNKFVTPQELRKLLLDEYCVVGPTLGLRYNPFHNHWSFSNFAEVNYALVATTR